jgi:TolB-like protein
MSRRIAARRFGAILVLASFLSSTNCAAVRPYRVTNYFRSAKLERAGVKRVAVLPFENLTNQPAAAGIVGDEFGLQLGRTGGFDLVERNRIEELWDEQDLDTLFRFDPQSAAAIGRMLGAHAVVLGSVTQFEPHPGVAVDTTRARHPHHDHDLPPVIIVDDRHDRSDAAACAITAAAIILIVPMLVVLLGPRPPAARVGASVRLVDVETGDILWQAKDAFRGDQRSVQALVEQKEDRRRMVYDVEYLTRILCQELAGTLTR